MAGDSESKMHMRTPTGRRWLRTDLLQGDDVAFVQVQLGCTQLFLLIADHLLVQRDFIVLPRQHPLARRKERQGRDNGGVNSPIRESKLNIEGKHQGGKCIPPPHPYQSR